MSTNTIISLLIFGVFAFMMFRGGGCCGSHGGHEKHKEEGKDSSGKLEEISSGQPKEDQ